MTAITFDTHFFIKKLVKKGVPEIQAEAIIESMVESRESNMDSLATKGDLEAIKADIQVFKSELKTDTQAFRSELKADIRELELRLQNQIQGLQIRIGAMMMALGGVLIAIKYFG